MAQDIDKIKDIFGIDPKEKHESDDEVYGELSDAQNQESFAEKVNIVKDTIGDVVCKELEVKNDKPESTEEIITDVMGDTVSISDDVANIIQETNQEIAPEEFVPKTAFADVVKGGEDTGEINKMGIKGEYSDSVGFAVTDGEPIVSVDLEKSKTASKPVNLEEWNLTSPSPKFDAFYSEKANILNRVLKSDMIPIERYTQDLIDAKVDVSVPIYDLPQIHKRMQEVQAWRDRVKEIQMNCNSQYYKFETAYEFLKGLLARVEYAKPAAKQEGVIYEHLSDFGLYFSDLKGIHRSAEIVSKNLDSAYETLSRQLTIALPNKNVERLGDPKTRNYFDPREQENVKAIEAVEEVEEKVEVVEEKVEIPDELQEFDILDEITSSVKKANEKPEEVDLSSAAKEASWDLL